MSVLFRLKRGLAAALAANNPVLGDGEPGYSKDAGIIKIGDGTTAWADLPILFSDVYLRKTDKAADSELLDGLDSSSYLRRMEAYSQLTSFTFDLTSENKLFSNGGSSAVVYTVPADASVNFPIGTVIDSMLTGTGSVTLTASSGVIFVVNGRSLPAASSFVVPYRFATVRLYKRSANLWNLYILSDQDTGWIDVAAGAFPAAWTSTTWAVGMGSAYRIKNGNLFVRVFVTYASGQSTITPDAAGNIGDVTLLNAGAIPAAYIPTRLSVMAYRTGVAEGQARINTDGSVQLTTWNAGATITPGATIEMCSGPWPID